MINNIAVGNFTFQISFNNFFCICVKESRRLSKNLTLVLPGYRYVHSLTGGGGGAK